MNPQACNDDLHADQVVGVCPTCGSRGLFLGSGGHVTCSVIGCHDPAAPSDLLQSGVHAEDVAISPDAAEIITEAVASFLEDIGNGRQWGFDDESHEENVELLANAYEQLQARLEEADDA